VIDASNSKKIAVLGAPIDIGASQRGTLMGPAALRTAGLLTLLDGLGFEVRDHGDLVIGDSVELADAPPDNAKHYREIQRWTRALSARAYELAQSAIPIFLGGDHTLSMGSVNGIARHWHAAGRELFVVWLDAHADYNTPATTLSGNMHGMSAAFLCGEPGLDCLLGVSHAQRSSLISLNYSACVRSTNWRKICCAAAASALPICARSMNSALVC
jgi:Arginase/agmatinase/formimionoglutamate hydrolase, arginase family